MRYAPDTTPGRWIYIDVSAAVHARSGLGRYAESLARALLAQHPDEIALFFNRDPSVRPLVGLETVPQRTVDAGYKRWRMQVWMGQLGRRNFGHLLPGARLYHATEHLLMPLPDIPTVLTVHDLIFRHFHRGHKLLNWAFLNLTVPLFCRRADAIIAVSEHTRQALLDLYHLPPGKVTVIYEAAAPCFVPQTPEKVESVRRRYSLPNRYLLTVGVIEPKKNHRGFLRAFEQLVREQPDLYWVIVGSKGWLYESFFAALEASPARPRVYMPGYIHDADLPAVYAGAQAFVFPSLYEGFGLPPLEAMACGTPVLSSNRASLPEVCGNAALYFDPTHTEAMVETTRQVLSDPDLRRAMTDRGLSQAARFSWGRTAAQTWQLYQTLIEQQ